MQTCLRPYPSPARGVNNLQWGTAGTWGLCPEQLGPVPWLRGWQCHRAVASAGASLLFLQPWACPDTRLLCKPLYPMCIRLYIPCLLHSTQQFPFCFECHLFIISQLSSLTDVNFKSPLYLISNSRGLLPNVLSCYYQSPVYMLALNSVGHWFTDQKLFGHFIPIWNVGFNRLKHEARHYKYFFPPLFFSCLPRDKITITFFVPTKCQILHEV